MKFFKIGFIFLTVKAEDLEIPELTQFNPSDIFTNIGDGLGDVISQSKCDPIGEPIREEKLKKCSFSIWPV